MQSTIPNQRSIAHHRPITRRTHTQRRIPREPRNTTTGPTTIPINPRRIVHFGTINLTQQHTIIPIIIPHTCTHPIGRIPRPRHRIRQHRTRQHTPHNTLIPDEAI